MWETILLIAVIIIVIITGKQIYDELFIKKLPLIGFVIENTWIKKAEKNYIERMESVESDVPKIKDLYNPYHMGWGNGYVIVPKGHPVHGLHYDDINVDVNGGLTFSRSVKELKKHHWLELTNSPFKYRDAWVVGFDTAHYGDTLEKWPKEAVEAETERLKQQLINYKSK